MSIVLVGLTSGSITLQEPAIAGTTTLNLPATSGTVLVGGTQNIPKSALPTGSVLQVVNATTNTAVINTSSTFADTGLTATITPMFATSKILVLADQNGIGKSNNTDTAVQVRLLRNGSQIIFMEDLGAYTAVSGTSAIGSVSTNYLDSPATTSAVTYKGQFANRSATGNVNAQWNGGTSTITLLEIAA